MSTEAFLARQPIVDNQHKLIGYELLFRPSQQANNADTEHNVSATLHVITNTLCDMGTKWLLQGKTAFINVEQELLMGEFITLLPADKVVIEMMESVDPTPELLDRLAQLKKDGYRFALDKFKVRPGIEKLLPHVSFLKIDMLDQPPEQITALVKKLAQIPVKLIAERVESLETFKQCQDMGFHFFQGYYFAHPENLVARVMNPGQTTVLQLLDKVRNDAEVGEIETLFKQDVALTFKLLRYINSAGFGLSCEVQSIRHAVSILGMKPLYRWLTLLLATAGNGAVSPAQARTAITRGRLCELLGAHFMSKTDQDNLFITGVFSLLDAMLDTPMEDILERLIIPQDISDALLTRDGMYGPILALAEACETHNLDRIDELAESLMLTPDQVNQDHLNALGWVEQLGLEG